MLNSSNGTKTRLYIWEPSSSSKGGHISIQTYHADGRPDIYASFWPKVENLERIRDAIRPVTSELVERYIDDIERMRDQSPHIILEICDLNIEAIKNTYQKIKTDIEQEQINYVFLPTLSLYGLNCASFVHRLLRAGDSHIQSISPSKLTEKMNIDIFLGYLFENLINTPSVSIAKNSSEDSIQIDDPYVIGRIVEAFYFSNLNSGYMVKLLPLILALKVSIDETFGHLWLNHFVGKLNYYLHYRRISVEAPDFIRIPFDIISAYYFLSSFGKEEYNIKINVGQNNIKDISFLVKYEKTKLTACIYLFSKVFFYFRDFMYERTLSPYNIRQIILHNIPHKVREINGEFSNTPNVYDSNYITMPDFNIGNIKIDSKKFLLFMIGVIYSLASYFCNRAGGKISAEGGLSYSLVKILQMILLTQLIHFNVDASYIAMFSKLPFIRYKIDLFSEIEIMIICVLFKKIYQYMTNSSIKNSGDGFRSENGFLSDDRLYYLHTPIYSLIWILNGLIKETPTIIPGHEYEVGNNAIHKNNRTAIMVMAIPTWANVSSYIICQTLGLLNNDTCGVVTRLTFFGILMPLFIGKLATYFKKDAMINQLPAEVENATGNEIEINSNDEIFTRKNIVIGSIVAVAAISGVALAYNNPSSVRYIANGVSNILSRIGFFSIAAGIKKGIDNASKNIYSSNR